MFSTEWQCGFFSCGLARARDGDWEELRESASWRPGLCEVLRRRGGRQQPGRGRTEPTVLISGWLRLGSVCLLEQSRRNCSRKARRSCSCGELGFSSRLELVDTEAAARLWVSPR